MNFDDWQELWQKQTPSRSPDTAALQATIRRVRAEARAFDRAILWRDLREIVAALAAATIFAGMARACTLEGAPAWSLTLAWLAAVPPLGVAAFLVSDRLRTRRLRPTGAGTVLSEIDHALAELRHQQRLLMNVTWWYLLPLATSAALVMVHPIAVTASSGTVRLVLVTFTAALLAAVNYPIWRLNRRFALRKLAPRIEQLERERRDLSGPVSPGSPFQ